MSGVMLLAVVPRGITVTFSSVSRFRRVHLFSFINTKACTKIQMLPNRLPQTAASCRKFGCLWEDNYTGCYRKGLHALMGYNYATVERSRVRFPMRQLDFFFNLPNLSSRTMALGSTQPLTEMNTRNLPGSKGRTVRKADNLAVICEPIV
jgi:hypothetical protein